jgi:hypothetical protein
VTSRSRHGRRNACLRSAETRHRTTWWDWYAAAYMGERERGSTPEDASAAAGRYMRRSSTSSRRPHEVSYSIHREECAMNTIDTFASVIADRGMTVHVTPLSAESLGLAVVQKSPKSLVVQELNQGTGNYSSIGRSRGFVRGTRTTR